ncbi:polysaccharide deacetylase [Paenibacillus sp. JMULE4]|nr:polysaccharide deacetylase [Paenibacillus sp. JMULE4]
MNARIKQKEGESVNRFVFALLGLFLLAQTVAGVVQESIHPVYYRDKAIVLLYHDVVESFEPGKQNHSTVTIDQFREHLRMLKEKGFRIITMDAFVRFMLDGKPVPANAVVLTFDDGYESFYNVAFPVLQEFGVTASNFVVGVSSDLFNPDAEPHLTWDQMRELKEKGMGIYSHTYNLHRYVQTDLQGQVGPALTSQLYLEQKKRQEDENEYRNRISTDMKFMEKRLQQELGFQPKLLAFPFGAYNTAVVEEGGRVGIELFFTIEEGMNVPDSRFVRRINAGEPYMTAEALWHYIKNIFEKHQNEEPKTDYRRLYNS